jgi:hypothetical protein
MGVTLSPSDGTQEPTGIVLGSTATVEALHLHVEVNEVFRSKQGAEHHETFFNPEH